MNAAEPKEKLLHAFSSYSAEPHLTLGSNLKAKSKPDRYSGWPCGGLRTPNWLDLGFQGGGHGGEGAARHTARCSIGALRCSPPRECPLASPDLCPPVTPHAGVANLRLTGNSHRSSCSRLPKPEADQCKQNNIIISNVIFSLALDHSHSPVSGAPCCTFQGQIHLSVQEAVFYAAPAATDYGHTCYM